MMVRELHQRGMFAFIEDAEVPIIGSESAGTGGTSVDWVTIPRVCPRPGWIPLPADNVPGAPNVRIPRSSVRDVRVWDWYALFGGEWCWVWNAREGELLIQAGASAASSDPSWEGNARNGWHRSVNIGDVEVKSRWQPVITATEKAGTTQ